MSFTVDTSIARVTPGSTPTGTGTTASFTPAVGDLLVVCAAFDNAPATAVTISDSQSGTWTTVRSDSATDSPLTTSNITVLAYRLVASSASMTVTAASSGAFFQSFKVYRVSATGALSVGATGHAGSSSSNVTPTAYTSTAANSLMVVSAMTLLSTAASTSSDLTADTFFNGGLDDLAPLSGYKSLGAVGAQTFNLSATTGNSWHWAAIEVVEASTPKDVQTIEHTAAHIAAQAYYRQNRRPVQVVNRSSTSTDGIVSSTFGISTSATVTSNYLIDAALPSTFAITADASLRIATTPDAALGFAFMAEVTATVQQNVDGHFDSVKVMVEFTPNVWTDVTQWIKLPITIHKGRGTEFEDVQPGTATIYLENWDGRFTPGSGRSPYFPYVGAGRRLYVELTKHGVHYPRFTGTIQKWDVEFPGGSTNSGFATLNASDALAILGQRRMRSNFTEMALTRAAADGATCDAWEPASAASGMVGVWTNYSIEAAPGQSSSTYVAAAAPLGFTSDNDGSFGDVMTSSAGADSCTTSLGLQAGALQLVLHVKGPTALVPAGNNYVATFVNGTPANVCNLAITPNGAVNAISLFDATGATALGIIANMQFGQWLQVEAYSRTDNPARSDWYGRWSDGTTATVFSNANIDIRTFRKIVLPGAFGTRAGATIGGIAALKTGVPLLLSDSLAAASPGSVAVRYSYLGGALFQLPVLLSFAGSDTAMTALTGRMSGRSALDVLRELARTANGGIMWARNFDSYVIFIADDAMYPATPLIEIDVDGDLIGSPRMVDTSDTRPTRIEVEWPGGIAVAVDRVAEAAGQFRSARITTVAASDAAAQAIGKVILARTNTGGMRVTGVTYDLTNASRDQTDKLFNDLVSTVGALYPSQRIRLNLYPDLFGFSSLDQFVEGWTEVYETNNRAWIHFDLSAAPFPALPPIRLVGVDGPTSAVVAAGADSARRRSPARWLFERNPG